MTAKKVRSIKQLSQGVKASAAFFISSIISSGIVYFVTPIYTRLLSANQYGQAVIYYTWLELFGICAMFSLSSGIFNNGMIDYPEKRDEYSFSMLILSNIITFIFSILLISVYPHIQKFIEIDFSLIILMVLMFIFQPAYNFWMSRQRFEMKYKYAVFWSIVCASLSSLISIISILGCNKNKLYGRLFGAQIPLLIIYFCFYIYVAKKSKFKIERKYWVSAIQFNFPLIPHYLSVYILSSSDKIMISNLVNSTATAYYSVAYSIASIVIIMWSAVNSSLIPYTYEKCKNGKYQDISKVTMPIIFMFSIICVLTILVAPEIVSIMATDKYMEAVYAIPAVVAGVFFQIQYFIYANIVYYYKKTKWVMYASLSSAILNVVLNYIMISKFGYIAAGYTTLISYIMQAVMDCFAMKKVVGKYVYNMKQILIISLAVIVLALVSNFLYSSIFIRYIIIFIILIFGIVKRKHILTIIKI